MNKDDPNDPTPALPLPGEGADQSLRKKSGRGTIRPSPWQGGGWEGVKCPPSKANDDRSISPSLRGGLEGVNCQSSEGDEVAAPGSASPYSHPKTIFNPLGKKPFRQTLRKNLTAPERQLWQHLRNRQLGVKFRRQHGVGPYIADFYCPECALVIELDGESHFADAAVSYDRHRETFMQMAGINTLRFTNKEVTENVEGVIQTICGQIRKQQ